VCTIELLLLDAGVLEVGAVVEAAVLSAEVPVTAVLGSVVLATAVLADEVVATDDLAAGGLVAGGLGVVEAVPLDRVADEAQPAQNTAHPITSQMVLFFMAVRSTVRRFR
jgi:hypothetical protein